VDKILLGQLLIKARIISEKQLEDALELQKTEGRKLGSTLLKLDVVTEENIITFLSRQYGVPPINLTNFKFDPSLIRYVPYDVARRYHVIPLRLSSGKLRIAIADPSNHTAIENIKFISKMNISVYVAVESLIMDVIEKYYPASEKMKKTLNGPKDGRPAQTPLEEVAVVTMSDGTEQPGPDAPIEKTLMEILINAVKRCAGEIHIEPVEDMLRVHFRIDGILKPAPELSAQMKAVLASRIKKLFNPDMSETQRPQSGRIKFKFGADKEIDCRISTSPTVFGDKIILKIIDRSCISPDLAKLGFDEKQLHDFKDAIGRPQGIVLLSGPDDSGKTTTIYSALLHLNKPGLNIMTAEDPVEVNLFGPNQRQIKPEIGLTYVKTLESLLGQDPDVIMIGELTDSATVELAIKASNTSHLIISTLPAKDSIGILTKLGNIGPDPFAVVSAITMAVSQRLVRKICEHCKTEQVFDETMLLTAGFPSDMIGSFTCYTGAGCDKCSNTGYSGRTAIFEVIPVNAGFKELIMKTAPAIEIRHKAVMDGLTTLRQSGIRKVMDGITSVDEVLKATLED
jgi:type IV pilus assembly protein PilB